MDTKDRDRLLADRLAVVAVICECGDDMYAKADRIKAFLDGEKAGAIVLDGERVRLYISEESYKLQLQLRSEDIQEVEDLKYRLDDAIAKKC